MTTHNAKEIKSQQDNRTQYGQGLIEYAILIALVALTVGGTLTTLGGGVGNVYSTVHDAIAGEEGEPSEPDKPVKPISPVKPIEPEKGLSLTVPALKWGDSYLWSDPFIVDWLNNKDEKGHKPGSFAHPLRGQLPDVPKGAIIDPSIYTNDWWDQPDGKVDENGNWETTVYLDSRYRDPTIIRIDVKVDGKTIDTYETHINPPRQQDHEKKAKVR